MLAPDRVVALVELMARPDPDDLHRGYRLTQTGDPIRQRKLKRRLPQAYINQRRQDLEDQRTA